MSGMVTVARVELRLLTPTFVAGADQNRPELRASAIKSALRFWYRALNPHAVLAEMHKGPRKEDRIFGGSDENTGRSPVLFDVSCDANRAFSWADVDLDRFNVGAGKQRKNGLKYLIYSLLMQPNDERAGLPPGLRATLVMRAEKKELERLGEEGRRGWIAALWLFGNLGSLGTRSRRGLGSLKVTNWPPFEVDEWRKEAAALPSLAAVSTKEEWQARFGQGMNVLDGWFPLFNDQKFSGARWLHPHLGNEFKVIIMKGEDSWEAALASAGRVLQEFRSQKGNERDVKQAVRCGRLPVQAPQRVVFGLPLTFRYPPDEVQFVPTRAGARHASLLRLRVVELGKSVHPLLVRLAGPVPGVEPASDAKMEIRRGQHRKTIREELPPVESKLLDEFMDWLGRGA